MKGSWKLGTIAGIGIYVHWTFLLIFAWVFLQGVGNGQRMGETLETLALVLSVFGCVVLHELGHALMAQRFHVNTQDITLLPIGGVARLERIPEDPIQEFWIAVAGPAVNVVIAALLLGVFVVVHGAQQLGSDMTIRPDAFVANLMLINIFLVVFNMMPAFPMDGGRVLRAVVAHFSGDYVRATQIAAGVGQMLAILFGVVGLFGPSPFGPNPFLVFIALFVYLGAQEEASMVQMRSAVRGIPVRAAMMTRFRTLAPSDTLAAATAELLAGAQQDFPVVNDGRVVGMLHRKEVFRALSQGGDGASVGDVMEGDCGTVEDTESLEKTFSRMREKGCPSLPVLHDGRLVGLVTLENVGELMMINSAVAQAKARG